MTPQRTNSIRKHLKKWGLQIKMTGQNNTNKMAAIVTICIAVQIGTDCPEHSPHDAKIPLSEILNSSTDSS